MTPRFWTQPEIDILVEQANKSILNEENGIDSDKSDNVAYKLFNPTGAGTWYLTELEWLTDEGEPCQQGEASDARLFGLCEIFTPEWGYVMLSELADTQVRFGLSIERDKYWSGRVTDLKEIKSAARMG